MEQQGTLLPSLSGQPGLPLLRSRCSGFALTAPLLSLNPRTPSCCLLECWGFHSSIRFCRSLAHCPSSSFAFPLRSFRAVDCTSAVIIFLRKAARLFRPFRCNDLLLPFSSASLASLFPSSVRSTLRFLPHFAVRKFRMYFSQKIGVPARPFLTLFLFHHGALLSSFPPSIFDFSSLPSPPFSSIEKLIHKSRSFFVREPSSLCPSAFGALPPPLPPFCLFSPGVSKGACHRTPSPTSTYVPVLFPPTPRFADSIPRKFIFSPLFWRAFFYLCRPKSVHQTFLPSPL